MGRGMKAGHARHQRTAINKGATGKAGRRIGKRMRKGKEKGEGQEGRMNGGVMERGK